MRPFWVPCRALLCKTPKGPGEQQASGFDGVWGGLVREPESLRVRGGVTGSSTVSKELWDLVRPPTSGTSSQHHSLNRSLGSHSPQIRILLGITVHPLGMT